MDCAHKCFGEGDFFRWHHNGTKCECMGDWKCAEKNENWDAGKACDLASKMAGRRGTGCDFCFEDGR